LIWYYAHLNILVYRPQHLTTTALAQNLAELSEYEKNYPNGFDRFVDLSQLEQVQLNATEIRYVAESVKTMEKDGPSIRAAIYAPTEKSYAMSRIYVSFAERNNAEVQVFRAVEEACEWLGVKVDDVM
jgi:hypothetical protein